MKVVVRSGSTDLNPRRWHLALALVLSLGLLALLPPTPTEYLAEPEEAQAASQTTMVAEPAPAISLDPRTPLPAEARRWVEDTLAAMSLEERAGQVMMVRAFGEYYAFDAAQRQELMSQVADLALGGVVLFRSEAFEAAALVADLQDAAGGAGRPPLLIAADFEWGAEFRIGGAVPFPTAMAVGATDDVEAAEWMGRVTGRDARALGVHWIFAPVADVNNNPRNPVINVRSFGEDPARVGRLAAAFVTGAQESGAMATAKHFPGHGDTGVDSHIAMPVLRVDAERLQTVELAPFRDTIEAGVSSVMTAHLSVPAITADEQLPATLSRAVLTDLLRRQLDFRGLVVTDAMEMGGITQSWWSGEAAVRALAAGADVILLPPFPDAVRAAIVRGVESGELPAARLDDAARRVLEYKARLGLNRSTGTPELAALPERFAPVSEGTRAEEVAAAAVTLLRDRQEVVPFDERRWNSVLVVGVSDNDTPLDVSALASTLRARLGSVTARGIDGRTSGDEAAALVAEASRSTAVVMAVRAAVRSNQERISLPSVQQRYGETLARLDVPVVLVALGSPYVVSAFPDPGAAVVAYGWSDPLQRALARALTGEIPWRGKLPVSVPGVYPLGHGLERPAIDATLQPPSGRPGTLAPADLAAARAVLQRFVDSRAFPGATYAVGHRNVLVETGALGRMSYEADAPPMPLEAVFDLASVTKVVATTTVAMKAAEAGRVRLDYPVRAYLPEFSGPGKDQVTVRHLLLHVAGLPPFLPFYQEYGPDAGPEVRAEILRRIYAIELEAAPGARYAYSDLGIILLGEVLDRALGESYETFAVREIFTPLGMTHTRWRPPADWLPLIPPTERDPWRGRVVHGEVHDENAAVLGGIAPHAGLFSSAGDLAVFAQMLLNYGSYDHQRVLSRVTVDRWTRRQGQPDGSSRALGWDTATAGGSWAMFSDRAFGHTGFTGTSLWIDPQRELFVVLLTNRVHPTRDNAQIGEARVAFHTAVIEAVDRAAASR